MKPRMKNRHMQRHSRNAMHWGHLKQYGIGNEWDAGGRGVWEVEVEVCITNNNATGLFVHFCFFSGRFQEIKVVGHRLAFLFHFLFYTCLCH